MTSKIQNEILKVRTHNCFEEMDGLTQALYKYFISRLYQPY